MDFVGLFASSLFWRHTLGIFFSVYCVNMDKSQQHNGDSMLEHGHNAYHDEKRSMEPTEDEQIVAMFSAKDQARVLRRIDLRLITLCGAMYCVSLLDRTNLSNAAIAGYASISPRLGSLVADHTSKA